jgi:hypothetical protein
MSLDGHRFLMVKPPKAGEAARPKINVVLNARGADNSEQNFLITPLLRFPTILMFQSNLPAI